MESAKKSELIIVAGAGLSSGLSEGNTPTWSGLIGNGLAYCLKKNLLSQKQHAIFSQHLESEDLDELLGTAEFMSKKLEAPKGDLYARWLQDSFRDVKPTSAILAGAIRTISDAGIPICTLNYDTLLETVTGLPTVLMQNTTDVTEWMRGELRGILHLHGAWTKPDSCILSIRDYQTTLDNAVRDLIQRSLGSFKRMLFIGCGATFSDPNFAALVEWLRRNISSAQLQHYALVRESEVAARHGDKSWRGFVEPMSFGKNFSDLPSFLNDNFSFKAVVAIPVSPAVIENAEVLAEYRKFLLKDCGQMTIEGINADMDTSKQKFDIERLFVPLSVLPCPPEFSISDPDKDEKLLKWLEENKEPMPFGPTLGSNKRIALLALPGGGKTMLLKRLAVAYADPQRLRITGDSLPLDDFFPILIRCREWRDHIKSPLLTLLKNLPDITGQVTLKGFVDAVVPLLSAGKVLLLVDGLDEIHNDADRSTFVENLEAFLEQYENIHLVVTSREAGFSLVAPCLNRFCTKFRVAPLNVEAITLLCRYWHLLMTGDSPESLVEGDALAEHLVDTTALRRLAENPLLLTMLLVVKHGAGRLPPDRVSLYGRAVEVLLDTWNIKGHDALNLKEAIPQLACVAFELMRNGKQTATESELLALLEDARSKLPQIGRYAKDTPYEFLKRVELRSSLLLEAGHQVELGRTVPFYQFRHLTFQEYLAAVAAASGHYIGYRTKNTVLNPLSPFLAAEEWKEVVPMAAVLAGKQAESLIGKLVATAKEFQKKLIAGETFPGKAQWMAFPGKLPSPVARLTQCLVEEAEASQEILLEALQLVTLFARGCKSDDDWKSLVRGPYGGELLHQAWKLYEAETCPEISWIRNTCASLGAHRFSFDYWVSLDGKAELQRMISSNNSEDIGMGLLCAVGVMFSLDAPDRRKAFLLSRAKVEALLFHHEMSIWHAAAWLLGLMRLHSSKTWVPSTRVLDRLLQLWSFEQNIDEDQRIIDFTFSRFSGLQRDIWTPKLDEKQRTDIREKLPLLNNKKKINGRDTYGGACVIAFHAKTPLSDTSLARILSKAKASLRNDFKVDELLRQMGSAGQKYLTTK